MNKGLIFVPMRRRGVCNASLGAQAGDREAGRSSVAGGGALLCVLALAAGRCIAADSWGGAVDVASDYLVRGITRTNHDAALQLDLHYSNSLGFFIGAFASNTQIDAHEARDVEFSGYLGYTWRNGDDWRGRVLYNHYAYPWNRHGGDYDYDELDVQIAYQGWLQVSVNYSPNATRYLPRPYAGLLAEQEGSAEANIERPLFKHLSVTAGAGYSYIGGPEPGGYVYWSAGLAYDLRSVSLAVSFVDTSSEANVLFYNAAASKRLLGAAIWRF
jgi:uncharacterized protein (TIGR02001 family)